MLQDGDAGKVHEGFLKSYKSVEIEVLKVRPTPCHAPTPERAQYTTKIFRKQRIQITTKPNDAFSQAP